MHLFLIIFEEAIASAAKEKANALFAPEDIFEVSQTTLLLRAPTSDPGLLNQTFGLSDDASEPNVGVIFKLNGSYSGYHHSDLWDWLKKVRETIG